MEPPLVAPAPTMVCISSMKRMAFSFFSMAATTLFSLFSKSPRYLVPATRVPMSRRWISTSRSRSGHLRRLALGPGLFVLVDAQGQPFGHGRLADARFADQQRIVFLAAAENLHDPVQLVVPADEGVDLALGRQIGQIDGKLFQRLGSPCRLFAVRGLGRRGEGLLLQTVGRQFVGDEVHHLHLADAHRGEKVDGMRFFFGQDRDQDIAAVNLVFAAALDVGHGPSAAPC